MLMEPLAEVLIRTPDNKSVHVLNYCADAVEDLVNMGTYVFKWEHERKKESIESLPLLVLYRNFLEMIDAISVLLRQCCVDACQINLRVALDTMFQLEYLLKSDTERRAYAYIVYNKLKKIDKLKKSVPDSQEYKEFMSHFKNRAFMDVSAKNFYTSPHAEKEIEASYASLNTPDLEEYKIEYKKVKTKYWYSFFGGPKDIQQLSGILNKQDLYETLYRDFSGMVHSDNILDKNIIASADSLTIAALRPEDDIRRVSEFSAYFFRFMMGTLIEYRYPDKKDEFMNWWSRYKIHYNKLFVTV